MKTLPRASGPGGKERAVRIHRARAFFASFAFAAIALMASVATVLADGPGAPIPK